MIKRLLFSIVIFGPVVSIAGEGVQVTIGQMVKTDLQGFKEIRFDITEQKLRELNFGCTSKRIFYSLVWVCDSTKGYGEAPYFTLLDQPASVAVERGGKITVKSHFLSHAEVYQSVREVYGSPTFTLESTGIASSWWIFSNKAAMLVNWYPDETKAFGLPYVGITYESPEVLETRRKMFEKHGFDLDRKSLDLEDL